MKATIRNVQAADLSFLKKTIDSTELFPSELLDEMIDDYLHNSNSQDIWITSIDEKNTPISVAFCAPEKLTEGTYNLYAIAVHKNHQGKGVGADMMRYLENRLSESNQHLLIVETSSLPTFELTRQFYVQLEYHQEAIIRNFYSKGDDKVIFIKQL